MLYFVVALKAEARAVIDYYQLQPSKKKSDCQVYKNEKVTLLITGMGAEKSALSLSNFISHISHHNKEDQWVNYGLAGHRDLAMGSFCPIAQLCDTSRQVIYECKSIATDHLFSLITVAEPKILFDNNYLYDMEARSLFEVLKKWGLESGFYIFKIVSDNQKNPGKRLSKGKCYRLLFEAMPQIEKCLA